MSTWGQNQHFGLAAPPPAPGLAAEQETEHVYASAPLPLGNNSAQTRCLHTHSGTTRFPPIKIWEPLLQVCPR